MGRNDARSGQCLRSQRQRCRYPYFFCIGRMKGTGCKQPYVPVDLIEAAVEDTYGDVAIEHAEPFATLGRPGASGAAGW